MTQTFLSHVTDTLSEIDAEGVHQVAGDVYLLLRVLERLRPVGGARPGGAGRADPAGARADFVVAECARRVRATERKPRWPHRQGGLWHREM